MSILKLPIHVYTQAEMDKMVEDHVRMKRQEARMNGSKFDEGRERKSSVLIAEFVNREFGKDEEVYRRWNGRVAEHDERYRKFLQKRNS